MSTLDEIKTKILEQTEKVARKLGLVSDIYKVDKNGEYTLANSRQIQELLDRINELKKSITNLSREVENTEEQIIDDVDKCIDEVIGNVGKQNIDITKIISTLERAKSSIGKDVTNSTTQVEIGEITQKTDRRRSTWKDRYKRKGRRKEDSWRSNTSKECQKIN